MPTYEYQCLKCHHTFDAFQSMSEEPLKTCPVCGDSVKRLISPGAAIIFKGSGFYITDYRKKESKKSTSEGGSPSESKPSEMKKEDTRKEKSGAASKNKEN
jgi:putative FmdB family regulatory protein